MRRFEAEFLDFLRREHERLLDGIRESGKFDDDTETALDKAYDEFAEQFETSEGERSRPATRSTRRCADEDVEQEQIVKQKRG